MIIKTDANMLITQSPKHSFQVHYYNDQNGDNYPHLDADTFDQKRSIKTLN